MVNQYLPPVITIPSSLLIVGITQSMPMVITVQIGNTTTEANTYIVGMAVKLVVPKPFGMYQANNLVGTIIQIIDEIFFVLSLDSTYFDAFVIPSGNVETPASICPNGSRNLQYNNTTGNVPFQSLNNMGN